MNEPPFLRMETFHNSQNLNCHFPQKEDDENSGSGDPPKKKPTRLAIGNSRVNSNTFSDGPMAGAKNPESLQVACVPVCFY